MKEQVQASKSRRDSHIPDENPESKEFGLENESDSEGPDEHTKKDFWSSVKDIFAWRNYSIYLLTAWVYNAGFAISSYFNLYLWTLYGDYILIGAMLTIYFVIAGITRMIGGYVGDVVDRKNLSVIAMLIYAAYYVVLGLYTDPVIVMVALMCLACVEIVKGGSSAYIMDNIPREHSGLALSLFTAGRSLGIITLLIFGAMLPLIAFGESLRIIYLAIGILLLLCTVIRAVYLESSGKQERNGERHILKDFIAENGRIIKLILTTVPGMLAVMIIDGISDSIFKFGALIYTNVTLDVEFAGINIILLATLIIQVPLLLKVGRFTDRMGVQKASLLVYAMMPISAYLLFIAEGFTYWMPLSVVSSADSVFSGLGVIFSTPFIAIVMKYVNDSLWWLVLFALVRRKMPQKDTSKILAVFMTTVYICGSIGPLIGGFLFELMPHSWLFFIVLVLNLLILLTIAGTRIVEDESEMHIDAENSTSG
ncbi:MAG: MFS transporter [Candidatus Thorarchaeota archaeon]